MDSIVGKMFRNALMVQIVAVIVGVIGMVVDGAVTGSCLGTDAMAAYGFATPIATIYAACATVCGIGTSLLVGRLVGSRRIDEASKALSTCLAFSLGLSIVLVVGVFSFSHEIAALLGAQGIIADMASDYLRGFCLCAPAMLAMMVLMPVVQIDGDGNLIMLSVVGMTIANIAGDLLVGLVFKGGLLGMALATTISYVVGLAIMMVHFLSKKKTLQISPKLIGKGYLGDMLKAGSPNALQQLCKSLSVIVLNRQILKISDSNSVAAFTAIMSAANLCMALGSGIGSSASMLTGVFAGDRDDIAIDSLMKTAITKAIIYDLALCAVLIAGAGFIMPIFTSSQEVAALAIHGFRLYCLSMIGYSINVTFRSYYQAMNLSLVSYLYVLFNGFLLVSVGAVLLGNAFGLDGVWLAFLFSETMSLVLLVVFVLLKGEKGDGLFRRFLLIPNNLTAGILGRYDGLAKTSSEMVEVSEDVRDFCKRNDANFRTSYVLSLAVEEFGEYILKSNSTDNPKEAVDVRLLRRDNGWVLRIRDNGKRFNPLDILKEENMDDFSYVGIKMLMDMVPSIDYLDTLNINNLNMEVK